jgi:hypothetical protein
VLPELMQTGPKKKKKKTNKISFTTHPLDIAFYILMYHITW